MGIRRLALLQLLESPTRWWWCLTGSQKREFVGRWVVEGVVLSSPDPDHTSFGNHLLIVLFGVVIFDVGMNFTTRQFQSKLLPAACREQTVDIQSCQSIQQDQW